MGAKKKFEKKGSRIPLGLGRVNRKKKGIGQVDLVSRGDELAKNKVGLHSCVSYQLTQVGPTFHTNSTTQYTL